MKTELDPVAYTNEINQFFDQTVPVPVIFSNGNELRREYFEREEYLKKISNCNGCETIQFRAYFILKLMESIKEVPVTI
jgi:hypothetical protein